MTPQVRLITDTCVEVVITDTIRVDLPPGGGVTFTRGGSPVQPPYHVILDLLEGVARKLVGDVELDAPEMEGLDG